jgi:DNA uptake protein ComE-like DNA-binding protein
MFTRLAQNAGPLALLLALSLGLPGTLPASAEVGSNPDLANPNLATAAELLALPHFDEALVARVLEGRPFLRAASLHEVLSSQIGAPQLEEVYRVLWLPINLNDASEAEILLIPGVGKRMAHEFDEYRPYKAMAQFRREIGKYVDDDEVARLEKYVYVPIALNTASREEILSIPGVGQRMAHEFEEYRPYESMAQFRREIGKYVDEDEVTRLERYVTLDSP